jgi:calcineurin-like phosphoesterase family protein
MINVGVDAPGWDYKPVHVDQIKEIISKSSEEK